jgi:colanic acid biosynthesis glycosyl transferase WcaI
MDGIYACADALLVLLRDSPAFHMTVPHKLLAYMASAKPIIGAVAGDAATAIAGAGAGTVCRPGDPQALADAVRWMHQRPPDERQRMGDNGRRAALAHYERRQQADVIAKMLQAARVAHQPSPGRTIADA